MDTRHRRPDLAVFLDADDMDEKQMRHYYLQEKQMAHRRDQEERKTKSVNMTV